MCLSWEVEKRWKESVALVKRQNAGTGMQILTPIASSFGGITGWSRFVWRSNLRFNVFFEPSCFHPFTYQDQVGLTGARGAEAKRLQYQKNNAECRGRIFLIGTQVSMQC